DTLDGSFGADTIRMGSGNDTVVWNPGGSSDTIEGEDGDDTLVMNGSAANERIELANAGGRLRLTRDVAAITLDVDGVERVGVRALRGADNTVVGDLTGTAVARVNVALAALTGDPAGDATGDVVTVAGAATDTIDVAADGAALVATGLGAQVRVSNGDPGVD